MAIRVFKQEDGRYAVFSNTVDSFLLKDSTAGEVREWYIERQREKAERKADELLENADSGEWPHPSGPRSYDEAREYVKELGDPD